MLYQQGKTPLAVLPGKSMGRDRAVTQAARSAAVIGYSRGDRRSRSNISPLKPDWDRGSLPLLEFPQGVTRKTLGLTGEEGD